VLCSLGSIEVIGYGAIDLPCLAIWWPVVQIAEVSAEGGNDHVCQRITPCQRQSLFPNPYLFRKLYG
jgi:hypothetical protein